MNKLWVKGLETEVISFHITAEQIREYCQLVDYLSDDSLSIPYTYPSLFWQYFHIPWLTNDFPVILVEQAFSYKTPLQIERKYEAKILLKNVKKIKKNTFLYHELYVFHQNILQVTMKSTLIYKE